MYASKYCMRRYCVDRIYSVVTAMRRVRIHQYFTAMPLLIVTAVGALCAQPAQSSAPAAGILAGEAVESDGVPAPDLLIRIESTTFQTTTAANGSFSISNVPHGTYRVVVTGDLYEPRMFDEVTVGPEKVPLHIVVRPRSVLTRELVHSVWGREQPLAEAPASATVWKGADLKARGITTVDQVLALTPGIQVSGQQVNVRSASGIAPGAGSRALLLIDGIPIPAVDNGRLLLDALPSLVIDQIEVVRGASSSIYGAGGVSGTINVIPRRAASGAHIDARIHGGIYSETDHAKWNWWGSRTQAFDGVEAMWRRQGDDLGITLAGSYTMDESYRQFDDIERYNLYGGLGWTIDRSTDLRLSILTSHSDHGGYYAWRNVDSALYAATPESHSSEAASLTSVTGQLRRISSLQFSYAIRAGAVFSDIADERPLSDLWRLQSSAARYFADVEWNSVLTPRISFTYGAGVNLDDVSSETYGDHVDRTGSLRAQMEFSNRDDITAMIQARFDAINEVATGKTELQLSPGVGVSYRPVDETTFRVQFGRGYRMPTIAERYVDATIAGARMMPNRQLMPEVVWHGEAGIAQGMELESMLLRFDCALYTDEYFSMIEPVLNPSDGNVTFRNLIRGHILGADLQLRGEMADLGLSFTSDLSVASAKNLKLNIPLPSRSLPIGHFSLMWQNGIFSIIGDYRYAARIERVDSLLLRIITDAGSRNATHNVDLHLGFDLKSAFGSALVARVHVRNLFQHYHTEGIGDLGPIRSFEVGLEGRF
jgi:iron complex outermembrane receptor protein